MMVTKGLGLGFPKVPLATTFPLADPLAFPHRSHDKHRLPAGWPTGP